MNILSTIVNKARLDDVRPLHEQRDPVRKLRPSYGAFVVYIRLLKNILSLLTPFHQNGNRPGFTFLGSNLLLIFLFIFFSNPIIAQDSDGDGVVDSLDFCVSAGGVVNSLGCPFPAVCDTFETATISFDTAGMNMQTGYITIFVLADSVGVIVDTSSTPQFTNVLAGKYMLTALDYQDDGSLANFAVGDTLDDVTANCLDWSDALTYRVCAQEDCSNGIDDDEDGYVDCADNDCGVSVIDYTIGQEAFSVVGQSDFVSSTPGTTDSTFDEPQGLAVDPTTGKVFVSDYANNRILRYASTNDFLAGLAAEAVIGQTDFTSNTGGTLQNKLSGPSGIMVDDSGILWVSDYFNNRILRFNNASTIGNGANADGVLGQADFTSSVVALTQSGMESPTNIFVENDGTLWVSDRDNMRALRFDNAATLPNGANADGVLGQPDFTTSVSLPNSSSLGTINGITVIEGNLYAGTYGQNRILIWNDAKNKPNGAAADRVLGQTDFTTTSYTLSQSSINFPFFLSSDKDGNLYVSDVTDNRILVFLDVESKANGANADYVLGQPDFTSTASGTSEFVITSPAQMVVLTTGHETYLALAEYGNNRILLWRQFFETDELTAISGTLNGIDLSGGGVTNFTILTQPGYGTVTLDDPTTGDFTYTPPGNCPLDVDTTLIFRYSVANANGCLDTADVEINLSDVAPCSEICNNGIDDDGDGDIDCADSDCVPTGVTLVLPDTEECVNNTVLTLSGGSPAGGTYSGPGVSGGNFNAAVAGLGVHTITYTYTDANGCVGTATDDITVIDLTPVTLNLPDTEECVSSTTLPLSGGTPAGGNFSGLGVSGTNFNPSIAGAGVHIITYSYTDANGCTNTATDEIVVFALPTVSLSFSDTEECVWNTTYALNEGLPAGGTYSGPGVSGTNFDASAAGLGIHTITYTFTDVNGCTDSATDQIDCGFRSYCNPQFGNG